MASPQPSEPPSTNKRESGESDVAEAVARYVEDLQRAPLALRTREAYGSHVAAYGRWLSGRPGASAAIAEPRARDHAAREFKRFLKLEQAWKPASVNLALAAIDHFNRFVGLGPAIVTREPLAQTAPRALSENEQRALLHATEDGKPRDRAIVVLLLYTALRLSELVALDVGDARMSARKGLLVVRSGKGDQYREVPLNRPVRAALEEWLKVRAKHVDAGEPALFVGPQGRRLSARAVDLVIRKAAARAGLELSAHVLRHTCVTNLVRDSRIDSRRALTVDAERYRPTDIAKMSDARRIATLTAFAITAAERGQDDALEQFDRLHGELLLRVNAQSKRERLADSEALDAAARTLMDACRILLDDDVAEPLRDAVFAAVKRDELADAVGAMARLARSPDDRARELVLSRYRGVRRYLPALLDTMTFLANDAGEPILAALTALRATAGRRVLTPELLPTAFVSRPWRTLVEPKPGEIDRGAYTMCALESLRDALRRRDVYVTPSERYADARASLLGDAAWNASREDTQRSLSLPAQPEPFLQQLGAELDDAFQRTRDALTPQHPIHELAAGALRVEQLDALGEPASLADLRDRVNALLPPADLPDLVLEIAAKTGFIDAFANDQEPGAQLGDLHTSLCAVLVAQACNVGYKPLVDESNPALREARLRYVAQRYLRPETLAAANAQIVDFHARLELAERWGGGEVASIDGLRFVVPRRTIHAAYNRRYFDRRRGVTLLGTTADHYAGLHHVVITGTQPDAPFILDGLLDPETSVRPREIVTDTAGYTDVIFGLFRLLGYQYSPRLADAGGATFWRINPTDHGSLNALARHQVNTSLIEAHYDDLLRVAGSLLQRHTTASQLVRALRSHTRHLASLARALQHVGRAAKTIHLLDYCNDQPFRRRILTQLNRGESRHALARDVCHGHRGELRQRYRQGQEEQLGALGLIVNAIVLYNTIYTQRALDHLAATGIRIDDIDVERLSPLGTDHITLTGRYRIALPDALRDRGGYRQLNTTPAVAA